MNILDEHRTFGWSNSFRAVLTAIFVIPFADIFVQIVLENWAWLAVSAVFSVFIMAMIVLSYRRPFIELADGVLRFYLTPIATVVFQSIGLYEIASFSVRKKKISMVLIDGRRAGTNLFAMDPGDREAFLEILRDTARET